MSRRTRERSRRGNIKGGAGEAGVTRGEGVAGTVGEGREKVSGGAGEELGSGGAGGDRRSRRRRRRSGIYSEGLGAWGGSCCVSQLLLLSSQADTEQTRKDWSPFILFLVFSLYLADPGKPRVCFTNTVIYQYIYSVILFLTCICATAKLRRLKTKRGSPIDNRPITDPYRLASSIC